MFVLEMASANEPSSPENAERDPERNAEYQSTSGGTSGIG